ncbi:MAG: hypothetical protein LUD17_11695 [Bacteroidales bacterium]|nr:hypothetical protein [Bacteroidales bacterium]
MTKRQPRTFAHEPFRDYGFTESIFKIDGSGKAIRYHEFYNSDSSPNEDKLRKFVDNVLKAYKKDKEDTKQDEAKA